MQEVTTFEAPEDISRGTWVVLMVVMVAMIAFVLYMTYAQ